MSAEPIAIAGAGIAGLALAAGLHRAGVPVRIFEERTELAETGAGITLWPNALAALDLLGLGDKVRAAGTRVSAGSIRAADGRWLRKVDRSRFEAALGEPLIVIHRVELVELLADAGDRSAIGFGTAVAGYETNGSGVTVQLSDGTSIAAAALVGADGFRSAVARQLHPHIRQRYAGYTTWRGVANIEIDESIAGESWGPGTEFGCIPLGRGRTYWFAAKLEPEGVQASEGEIEYLRGAFANWHPEIAQVLAAADPAQVSRHDLYDRTAPRKWSSGAVTIVGDAAHPMRPHLGQGGCQALIDAAVVARLIGRREDPTTAFSEYQKLRSRAARRAVRESALAGRVINAKGVIGRIAHRLVAVPPERLFLRHLAAISGSKAIS